MSRHYNGRFRSRKSVQPPSVPPRPRMSLEEQRNWVTNHFSDRYENYSSNPADRNAKQEAIEAHQLFQEHQAEQDAADRFDDKALTPEETSQINRHLIRRARERVLEPTAMRSPPPPVGVARTRQEIQRAEANAALGLNTALGQDREERDRVLNYEQSPSPKLTPKQEQEHQQRREDYERARAEQITSTPEKFPGQHQYARMGVPKKPGEKSVKDLRRLYGQKAASGKRPTRQQAGLTTRPEEPAPYVVDDLVRSSELGTSNPNPNSMVGYARATRDEAQRDYDMGQHPTQVDTPESLERQENRYGRENRVRQMLRGSYDPEEDPDVAEGYQIQEEMRGQHVRPHPLVDRPIKGQKARVTPRGTVTGHLTDAMGRERCIQEGKVVPCPNSTYTPRVDERQRPSTNQKGIKSEEDKPDKVHQILDRETDLADAHFRIMPGDFTEARAKRDARMAKIEEARRQYDQKGIKAQRPHKGKAPRALEGERLNAQAQQTFPTNERDVQEGRRKEREINDEIDSQWIEAELFRPGADYEAYYDENDFKRMKGKALSANNALAGGSLIPPSVQGRFIRTNRNRKAITPPTVARRKAFGPPHSHTDSQKRDYHQPIGDPNVPNVHEPYNYADMSPEDQAAYDAAYARRHTRPTREEIEKYEEQSGGKKAIPSDPREPGQSMPPAEEIDLSQEPISPSEGEVRRAESVPGELRPPSVPPRKVDKRPIHIPPDRAEDLVQGEIKPQTTQITNEIPSPDPSQPMGTSPPVPAHSESESGEVIDLNEPGLEEEGPESVRSPESSLPGTGPGNPTIHVDEIARLMSQGELDQYAAEDVLSDLNALNEAELMEVYDRLVNEDFDAAFPGQTDELLNIIDGVEKLIKFKKPRLDADVQALNNPVELQNIVKSTPVKQYLAQANVVDMKKTGTGAEASGANTSYIYTLENGQKGVFKPQYGESPGLRQHVPGSYYVREVASSEVAEVLGLDDLLPSTVFRKDHDKIGSIQNFVPGVVANNLGVDDRFDGEDDLARAAAYDYLVGNTDRHDGNWMISNNGKLALIDNGLAFPTTNNGESFGNSDLIFKASIDNLSVPPIVQEWYDKWDQIESILRVRGVEEEAIYAMADRLQSLVNISSFQGLVRTGNWTDLQQWFY